MTDDAHAARRKHLNRTRRIEVELARLEVEDRIYVLATGRGVRVAGPGDAFIERDSLAAWDALIELPDGAGADEAWSALLRCPRVG